MDDEGEGESWFHRQSLTQFFDDCWSVKNNHTVCVRSRDIPYKLSTYKILINTQQVDFANSINFRVGVTVSYSSVTPTPSNCRYNSWFIADETNSGNNLLRYTFNIKNFEWISGFNYHFVLLLDILISFVLTTTWHELKTWKIC